MPKKPLSTSQGLYQVIPTSWEKYTESAKYFPDWGKWKPPHFSYQPPKLPEEGVPNLGPCQVELSDPVDGALCSVVGVFQAVTSCGCNHVDVVVFCAKHWQQLGTSHMFCDHCAFYCHHISPIIELVTLQRVV